MGADYRTQEICHGWRYNRVVRVAELVAPHRFRLIEQPDPEPGAGDVLVRVGSVGICGSDLHNFSEGAVGDMPSSFPMVLGHEPSGVVVRTGAGVTGWQPGDRAALEPAIYCYHCEYCMSGRHNVCSNLRFLSQPTDPGFFRDLVTLPAGNLLAIKPTMSLDEATLFEPLAVALHSMEFAQVSLGETAVVFGAGPIGLMTIAVLKLAGASRIFTVEPVPHRRELARAAGATDAFSAEDPVRAILSATRGRGVDVALDCATKGDTINQCLHVTRNHGRVVITGIPAEARISLEFHVMRRKELAFYNVRRSNHESREALRLLAAHPDLFRPMITHRRPLESIEHAFRIAENCEDGVGKAVITIADLR